VHAFRPTVPWKKQLLFAAALLKAGVTFELHVFTKGRHGLDWRMEMQFSAPGQTLRACVAEAGVLSITHKLPVRSAKHAVLLNCRARCGAPALQHEGGYAHTNSSSTGNVLLG